MLRGNCIAEEAPQRLKLLPGGAVAYEDEAPALYALAKRSRVPGFQAAGVGLKDLHSCHSLVIIPDTATPSSANRACMASLNMCRHTIAAC